jgi:MYXO-CTERM domain-containing protein
LTLATAFATGTAANAASTEEWASEVLGFSSQYSATSWSAAQTLGAPDTFRYGDIVTAWAPSQNALSLEHISVGYATPTYATGALVRETDGNGFVYQIDAIDMAGSLHTVWAGVDPSKPETPVDFMPTWASTPYLVKGLKIYVNTGDNRAWEEIDAIKLIGNSVSPVPESGRAPMMALGMVLMGASLRRRRH